MTGRVRFERHPRLAQVAVLTLDHPGKRNAVSVAMWQALRAVFEGLAGREPDLRAVIVRGADATFVAGGDIAEFPAFRFQPDTLRQFHEGVVAPALASIWDCDIPVVAQIEGACIGGGLEIAAMCDIRICGTTSRFGAPIARLGFPMAIDELIGLVRLAGHATAAEMLLEARVYDAADALRLGLVHRVVADAEVAAEAEASAARIAALAPQAARLNKRALRLIAAGANHPDAVDETRRRELVGYSDSDDHREGIDAFLNKRQPRFSGH